MFELYTGRKAYKGLSRAAVEERVFKQGLRPKFPAGTPLCYAHLAAQCWAVDPNQRLAFCDITNRLEQMCVGRREI